MYKTASLFKTALREREMNEAKTSGCSTAGRFTVTNANLPIGSSGSQQDYAGQHPCPSCGYCPCCGRYRPQPTGPFYQYGWTLPQGTYPLNNGEVWRQNPDGFSRSRIS